MFKLIIINEQYNLKRKSILRSHPAIETKAELKIKHQKNVKLGGRHNRPN